VNAGTGIRERAGVGCAVIAAVTASAVYLFGPPGVDAPAHLFQTWEFSHHGYTIWNNYWYAGRYQFVTYSVLFYPLAAAVGIPVVSVAAAAVMGGAFAMVLERRFGALARGPSAAFAVTAPIVVMVFGMYPFLAGASAAISAIAMAQRRSKVGFGVAAAVTAGFSPLAFLLLLVGLATAVVGARRPLRELAERRVQVAIVGMLVLAAAAWSRLFATSGFYAYSVIDLVILLAFCATGLYLAWPGRKAGPLRWFYVVYLVVNITAFLVPTPIGSNAIRLFSIAGGPMLWLSARVGRRCSPVAVAAIVSTAIAVQMAPVVADAYAAANDPAAAPSFWAPVERFLVTHGDRQHRVEVVATWGHWEAYYLASRGIPLARGWFRQDDYPTNSVLYRGDELTATAYRSWLRATAVRYVLLPSGGLDYTATSEAALLRSGGSGLSVVARLPNWTVYRLARTAALLTGPGTARIMGMSSEAVRMAVSRPGVYTLRVRYSPYWQATAGACASARPDGMTAVSVTSPGVYTIRVTASAGVFEQTLAGEPVGCQGGG
jgi:hypothetical protein